jgi:MFS family permease
VTTVITKSTVEAPRALRRVQVGNALAAFGAGFTVPFIYVYATEVRHLSAGVGGALFSIWAVAALLVLPVIGKVVDRRGPQPVLVASCLLAAAGSIGFGFSHGPAAIMIFAALFGAGIAGEQPVLATMVARCTEPGGRAKAFAFQFFLNNLGLGIGGLLGGLIVDPSRPASFEVLFCIEAAMILVLAGVAGTVRLPQVGSLQVEVPESAEAAATAAAATAAAGGGGYRAMLRDRAMVGVCVLAMVIFFSCYGQFESGLAAFATSVTKISPSTLGFALAANTAVIVVGQLLVLRITGRRRRSSVIAVVGLIWLAAWALAGVSGLVGPGTALATAAILGTYMLFGAGEMLLSPVLGPLVADLAPASQLGRYNAAFAGVRQVAMVAGPAFAGLMVGMRAYPEYLGILFLCTIGVSVLALRLGRRLTPVQNGLVKVAGTSASSRRAELERESTVPVA